MQPTAERKWGLRLLTVSRIEGLFTDHAPPGVVSRWPLLRRRAYPAVLDQPLPALTNRPARCRLKPCGKTFLLHSPKVPFVTKQSSHGVCDPAPVVLKVTRSSERAGRCGGDFSVVAAGTTVLESASSKCRRVSPGVNGRELVRCRAMKPTPARPLSTQKKRPRGRDGGLRAYPLRRVVGRPCWPSLSNTTRAKLTSELYYILRKFGR